MNFRPDGGVVGEVSTDGLGEPLPSFAFHEHGKQKKIGLEHLWFQELEQHKYGQRSVKNKKIQFSASYIPRHQHHSWVGEEGLERGHGVGDTRAAFSEKWRERRHAGKRKGEKLKSRTIITRAEKAPPLPPFCCKGEKKRGRGKGKN